MVCRLLHENHDAVPALPCLCTLNSHKNVAGSIGLRECLEELTYFETRYLIESDNDIQPILIPSLNR